MSKLGGGPAFPTVDFEGQFKDGMTRRQYIATAAMAALISHEGEMGSGFEGSHTQTAFRYADAMIAEGER